MKKFILFFLSIFIFYSCVDSQSSVSGVWSTCSTLQDEYIKALTIKCGEEIGDEHYNTIKTSSSKEGEHYYCKEKYNNYYGLIPIYDSKYHIVKSDENEYTSSTCEELTPYIGKRIEEESLSLKVIMSLNNKESCKALNNIFAKELELKSIAEADSLIEAHRNTWGDEDYYCDDYINTSVGKKTNGDKILFPENRSYCIQGLEEFTCDELKELVGKRLEGNIIAHGYYYEGEERFKRYDKQCSILFLENTTE